MSKIYDCIKRYSENNPDNISLTYREGESYLQINYRQLYDSINTLSNYLAEYKGKTIVVLMPDTGERYLSVL